MAVSRPRFWQTSGSDPWLTLEALGVYRIALCSLLLILHFAPYRPQFLGRADLFLFEACGSAYLLFSAMALITVRARWLTMSWQAGTHILIDVIAIIVLTYSSGGTPSGLATLLITPIAAASLVLQPRLAIASAAVASLGLLCMEAWRQILTPEFPPGYTQAGILGALLFIIAFAGSTLALRARDSEAFAVRVGSDLAKLARLNETIIQKLDAGVLVVDPGGTVQMQNSAADKMLGGQPHGRTLPELEPGLWTYLSEWLQNPERITDATLETSAKIPVWPQFTRLGQGDHAATLVVLEDAARIERTAQQIKLAALGRLTASIAHEIRNPLAAIRQAGQLLGESESLGTPDRSLIDIVERQTRRINNIVEDILGLSRSSERPQGGIELQEFLLRMRSEYMLARDPSSVQIILPESGAPLRAVVDPIHLERIIHNLWDNACSHARRDDEKLVIQVSLEPTTASERVEINVRDNGPGIPASRRRQVFEPFFSTDHAGTGLGLYITRELTEANGGHLRYIEGEATGAHFRVTLPSTPGNSATTSQQLNETA